jgi:hypothetical protein
MAHVTNEWIGGLYRSACLTFNSPASKESGAGAGDGIGIFGSGRWTTSKSFIIVLHARQQADAFTVADVPVNAAATLSMSFTALLGIATALLGIATALLGIATALLGIPPRCSALPPRCSASLCVEPTDSATARMIKEWKLLINDTNEIKLVKQLSHD